MFILIFVCILQVHRVVGVDFSLYERGLVCIVQWKGEDLPDANNLKVSDVVPLSAMVNAYRKVARYEKASFVKTPDNMPPWVLRTVSDMSTVPVSLSSLLKIMFN